MTAPRVLMTMGDAAGIGPEIVVKLLASSAADNAEVVIVGEQWVLDDAERVTGASTSAVQVETIEEVEAVARPGRPVLLRRQTIAPGDIARGEVSAAAGRSVLFHLAEASRLVSDGHANALCFAPLNKGSMKLGGLAYSDEGQYLAATLGHRGDSGEVNVVDKLWTTRVTSHVALRDVADLITGPSIRAATQLAVSTLTRSGIERPRIAVCALNPHAGDNGAFGREEIEIISPTILEMRGQHFEIDGPFPSDTVFRRALAGDFDAVVTMYHDQGQIALKLLGFERGVTIHGGLPIPITTPAHGTAFDIAGRNLADFGALRRAFDIAVAMGERRLSEDLEIAAPA